MEVAINWWAVILAAVAAMIVGSVWYTPKVLGNRWMKLVGKKPKDLEKMGWWPMGVAVIVSLLTAYILAHVTFLSHTFFHNSYFEAAISTAFWLWLGLTAARIWLHDAFEGRPWQLTLMNALYELVSLEAMAVILGLMQP